MNKRRLLKLADLLEADATNRKGVKFDMDSWGDVADKENPLSCSTQACAMGLAALSGSFKRAGLGFRIVGTGVEFTWDGRKTDGIRAARKLFGISGDDACELFTPKDWLVAETGAKAERAKAKEIRRFVSGKS